MQRDDLVADDVLSGRERRGDREGVRPVIRSEHIGCGPLAVGGLACFVDFEPDSTVVAMYVCAEIIVQNVKP